MRLRARAPAKVNLALFLGGIREADGRHELVTVFQALSLCDEIEAETLEDGAEDLVICPGVEGENLAARALSALRARGWAGPPLRVEITKRIPVAAGMAGGSADAAAVLRLAMELAPGRPEEVEAIAAGLGADVPSQLAPGVVLGTGAGELVEPYPELAEHAYVVVPSPSALATPAVFREADRLGLPRGRAELDALSTRLRDALRPGAQLPAELLRNDLEPAAVSLLPSVREALADVHAVGADHVLVSGSGPTVAGLWWGEGSRTAAEEAAVRLRGGGHPRASAARPVGAEYAAPELVGD